MIKCSSKTAAIVQLFTMENISILRSELENKKDPIDIIKDHSDGEWNYEIISKNFFFVYIR